MNAHVAKASIHLLGAEKQSAVSASLAYPERTFVLVSDAPVVDGWDRPNVTFRRSTPSHWSSLDEAIASCEDEAIALGPRWLRPRGAHASNRLGGFNLGVVLPALADRFHDCIASVSDAPRGEGLWTVKGDAWHRPDATVMGTASDVRQVADPYGCGIVFQQWRPSAETQLVVGRRSSSGHLCLGVFKVLGEAQCREAMLLAGETIANTTLVERTTAMLDWLDHRGWFSLNWVVDDGRPVLTSIRPVPRAVFQAMRHAGADLLAEPPMLLSSPCVARAGVKFVAEQHYSEYRELA